MEMPEGTIFAKGGRWWFDQISFKAQNMGPDFVYLNLCDIDCNSSSQQTNRLEEMLTKGVSYPMDNDGFTRDGCFDDGDIFLVFEKEDLLTLRDRIDEAIGVCDNL